MKLTLISLLLIIIVPMSHAQKQGNIWMFGQGGGLDFNSGSPASISGSQIFGNPTDTGDYAYSEGCSSIADSSGSLLFYSNGEKVWNKNNAIMPNGNAIMGFYSSTSAALIIPMPSSDSLYYLFTTDGLERYLQKGLRYSIINTCLDSGNGDVIASQKNILLLDTVSEKLCAIAHPNGQDIWLIAHKYLSDTFYAYQITSTGISTPVISNIGSIHIGNPGYYNGYGAALGQMKASPNGNKIGLAFANATPAVAEVFDFNSLTGIVNNPISLTSNIGNYGVEFSPDNTKFYLTSVNGIFQFDLMAGGGTQISINSSKTQITNVACLPGPLQLGPNDKIYISRCDNTLGVINFPNNLGTACNYIDSVINISPAVNNTSLPMFIAGYNYTNNKIPNCIFTSVDNSLLISNELKVYPNPFNEIFTIELPDKETFSLLVYDVMGRKVYERKNSNGTVKVDCSTFSKGIYFVQARNEKNILTYKLIKE